MQNLNCPKVSIITVVYNDKEHICPTIENVLKQTYPNLEYVVVDGGSTDGTLDIIKSFGDKLRWVSEKDNGIYDAMQKGAKLATGEWILFRNCGDFFITPDATSKVFEKYGDDKGEDFLLANSRYFNEYGYRDLKPAILESSFFCAMPVNHPATYIRRTTQLKYPFHLEYKNSADYCFFVEAFLNGATFRYFDVMVSLFDNRFGASTEHYDRSIRENIDIMKRFEAPKERVEQLQKQLRSYLLKQRIKHKLPFYNWYHKRHLENIGWTKCELSVILKDI